MKKADLEKLKGMKIDGRMKHAGTPGRFGAAADVATSRREQRDLERARGLVPFAVKLDGELVKRLQTLAQERKTGLNEVVAELLEKGLKG
jgi:hypothetical protein